MVEGLKAGLKELKLDEGHHFGLLIRDTRGDLNAVAEAARDFERAKVKLIFTASTSVSVAAHRATGTIAIVFGAGTDPVAVGLVQSVRNPGGRATGIHFWITEITGKRLELLREMIPTLKRVVTFYNPANPSAVQSVRAGREAAQSLGIELVERHVSTPEELRTSLEALQPGDMDAYLAVADAMVDHSQSTSRPPSSLNSPFLFQSSLGQTDSLIRMRAPTIPPLLLARADEVIE